MEDRCTLDKDYMFGEFDDTFMGIYEYAEEQKGISADLPASDCDSLYFGGRSIAVCLKADCAVCYHALRHALRIEHYHIL